MDPCVSSTPYLTGLKGNNLICFGIDKDQNGIAAVFNVKKKKWSLQHELPFLPTRGMGVVVVDGDIYIIENEPSSMTIMEPGKPLVKTSVSRVYKYCAAANTVVSVGSLSKFLRFFRVGVLDSKIYIVGTKGSVKLNRGKLYKHNKTVLRYDPQTNKNELLAATNDNHYDSFVVGLVGRLYVIGAFASTNVERYNAVTNQWSIINRIPGGRGFSLAAPWQDRVYFTRWGKERMCVYNPLTNEWKQFADSRPVAIFDLFGASDGKDAPFLLARDEKSHVYLLNPLTNEWSKLAAFAKHQLYHSVLLVRPNTLPSPQTPSPMTPSPLTPYPQIPSLQMPFALPPSMQTWSVPFTQTSAQIPSTHILSAETPCVQVSSTQIPSTQISSAHLEPTQISSTEIPSPHN